MKYKCTNGHISNSYNTDYISKETSCSFEYCRASVRAAKIKKSKETYKIYDNFKVISKNTEFQDAEIYTLILTEDTPRRKAIALALNAKLPNRFENAVVIENHKDITKQELSKIFGGNKYTKVGNMYDN